MGQFYSNPVNNQSEILDDGIVKDTTNMDQKNMDHELIRHANDNQGHIKEMMAKLDSAFKDQNLIIKQYADANKQLRQDIEKKENKWRMEVEEQVKGLQKQLLESQNKLTEAYKKIKCMEKIQSEYQSKNDDLKKSKSELEELKQQLYSVEQERNKLRQDRDLLQQERDNLNHQVQLLLSKQHATVHVQMYAAVNKKLCDKMMDELEGMLRMQFEFTNTSIQVEKYQQPPEDSPVPLIVICINASRLGTDVLQAVSNVNHSRTLAVVVLHHKEIHALPKQPSEKLLIGSEYKHINAIVDIAYLTNKGIYPCDMNERSLDRLVDFIKSNSHK